MKKYLLIFLLAVFCLPVFAQTGNRQHMRDPQSREKIRAAHAAYITERLELSAAEAEKFWPVYREYGERRREFREQFRDARKDSADEKALLELDLKIKQQELDLEKDYSQRLQKIVGAEKVLKLRHAEADFRKLIMRQVQQRHRRPNRN